MAENKQPVKIKKIPQRKCVGCGETRNKTELIRVLRTPDGTVCLDFTGKKSGRGAYICRDPECLKKARRSRRIDRNLDCDIPDEIYDRMEEELSEHV